MFRILAYGATHVGRERKNNEDAFRIAPDAGLYLVCDGMGGHASGEIASQIAADAMVRFVAHDAHRPNCQWPIDTPTGIPEESRLLDAAVRIANSEVFAAASANPLHKGMGTTVVGVVAGAQRLGLVHVGDSRIYRIRDGEFTQLTEDHSLLNFYIQTRPMSADQIKQFAGKNVIVRAVGLRDAVEPDVQVQDYKAGDVYLLCSDGLTDMVDDALVAGTLQDGGDQLAETAEKLIDHALNGGGKDNITVVLLRVVEVPDDSRAKLSARATLPMDTEDLLVDHDSLEDTSPGFDLNSDASDAETLTEIEVRQAAVVRKHATTQEVPYRPWRQAELDAPALPGLPLPQRRPPAAPPLRNPADLALEAEAETDPEAKSVRVEVRDAPARPNLAATAKYQSPRESQRVPVAPPPPRDSDMFIGADLVTADMPSLKRPGPPVRADGAPYRSGGVVADRPGVAGDRTAASLREDTERVDRAAREAQVAEARRLAEAAQTLEAAPRTALRQTAVDKPNPRRSSDEVAPAATAARPNPPAAQIYVPSTPPPANNPLTTLDESAPPEGLPLDDDDED